MNISILSKGSLVETQVVEFDTLIKLGELITNNDYSSIIFKRNYTKQENFLSSEMIVLDFDNYPEDPQLSLSEAEEVFKDFKHLIATTRNHQREKDGKPRADRFRVILFTNETMITLSDYLTTWLSVAKRYPATDQACKDGARRFFASQEIRHINETGKLIPIVKSAPVPVQQRSAPTPIKEGERGRLAIQTQDFMKNGALQGHWNRRLYKAARDYLEQGYTQDEFELEAGKIENPLDRTDLATIRSAFSKPAKYEPRVQEEVKDMPAVELWARDWLRDNEVTYSYKMGTLTFNKEDADIKFLISRMVLDAKHWAEQNPVVDKDAKEKRRNPYDQRSLEHVFNIWEKEQKKLIVNEIRSLVEYNPFANKTAMEEWLTAVTGQCKPLDVAVMNHFIWQVKRKLTGQHVDWHIMPIFYGPSGSGKTKAIECLYSIIDEVVSVPGELTVLEDSRNAHIFGKFFVVFFDEMSKAEKTNIDSIKNKITSSFVEYRILGTNSTMKERNVTTFIGASNKPVIDIIYDPTSARRFWQIDSLTKCDSSRVNSINYLDIWQSVNETIDTPLMSVLEEVLEIQKSELRNKSNVELWLESYKMDDDKKSPVNEDDESNLASVSELYDEYKSWGKNQEFKHFLTLNKFSRELSELGLYKVKRTDGAYFNVIPKKPRIRNMAEIIRMRTN